jgi:hypothetical protein
MAYIEKSDHNLMQIGLYYTRKSEHLKRAIDRQEYYLELIFRNMFHPDDSILLCNVSLCERVRTIKHVERH